MKSQLEAEFTAVLHLKFPWGRTFGSEKKISEHVFNEDDLHNHLLLTNIY